MHTKQPEYQLDRVLAAPMFAMSLVVLALFAALFNLFDVENRNEIVRWCLIGLAITYPVFWIETLVHWLAGGRNLKQHWWFCFLPILRVGARDHVNGRRIWLPVIGWQMVDRQLERYLAKFFSIPMILVALSLLPVIIIEFFWYKTIAADTDWQVAMQTTMAFIWAAFTIEFIVMISVVQRKKRYVIKHWIDLAIILLPAISFLRAARLTQLFRLQSLAKTARVYRLRGLAIRMWRGFVALEFIEKLLSRNPEWRLEKLEVLLQEKSEEMDLLKQEIAKLQKRIEEKKLAEEAEKNPQGSDSDEQVSLQTKSKVKASA